MIVEDNQEMAQMLATLLEFEGYRAVVCPSPEQALERMRETQADIVVMDFHLGEAVALRLLQSIRSDQELQRIKVIVVSGDDQEVSARSAGADAFLLKPFSVEELMQRIQQLRQLNPEDLG
ncbi:MAG: response regulator [Anaerolineae bacterium]|nr:response regulator [Thermoflexus sp.]MDW8065563.1 response regulator [Anaerolineae bacterium]